MTFYVCYSLFGYILIISSYGKLLSSFVFVFIQCVGAGITILMFFSDRPDPYFFPSKDGRDDVREGRNGQIAVYFPPTSAFFLYNKQNG